MGIYDRDWYRDEVKRREGRGANTHSGLARARSGDSRGVTSGLAFKVVVLILLMAAAAAVAHDMNARGVPFTWHGFKWWLSLWL